MKTRFCICRHPASFHNAGDGCNGFQSGTDLKVGCPCKDFQEEKVGLPAKAPEPMKPEVFSLAISKISESVKKMLSDGLNERAVICLIYDSCRARFRQPKPSKKQIKAVLESLRNLEETYCRK